jgi:hypothetical protein
MVSLTLFRLTKDVKYLTLANRIRFNALGYAQRPGGGFGTDKCVGLPADINALPDTDPLPPCNPFLSPSGDGISEAFWCCTMRGSEGLRSMLHHSLLFEKGTDGEPDKLWLPFATDVNADCGAFYLSVRSELPYDCRYTVSITSASLPVSLDLMIYTPAGIDRRHVELEPGETVYFKGSRTLESHTERSSDGRSIKYFRGDLLLGKKQGADLLRPLTDMIDLTLDEAGSDRRRILFDPE